MYLIKAVFGLLVNSKGCCWGRLYFVSIHEEGEVEWNRHISQREKSEHSCQHPGIIIYVISMCWEHWNTHRVLEPHRKSSSSQITLKTRIIFQMLIHSLGSLPEGCLPMAGEILPASRTEKTTLLPCGIFTGREPGVSDRWGGDEKPAVS